jgi:23S rRNA (uridine2552-2'-O)-methyltransferase
LRRVPQVGAGSAVVDLGCWPGGWLQVLQDRVGPDGRVVGVDLREVEPLSDQVAILDLDFTEPEAPERVAAALGRPADAVLCDAAPKLSGIRDVDRGAQQEIYEAAFRVMERVLRPRGAFVVKGFPGPEADRFRAILRSRFERVAEVRPEGKRTTSKEHYWVAGPDRSGGGRTSAGGDRRRKPRRTPRGR